MKKTLPLPGSDLDKQRIRLIAWREDFFKRILGKPNVSRANRREFQALRRATNYYIKRLIKC